MAGNLISTKRRLRVRGIHDLETRLQFLGASSVTFTVESEDGSYKSKTRPYISHTPSTMSSVYSLSSQIPFERRFW